MSEIYNFTKFFLFGLFVAAILCVAIYFSRSEIVYKTKDLCNKNIDCTNKTNNSSAD